MKKKIIIKESEGISQDTEIELSEQEDYYIENGKIIKYNKHSDNYFMIKRMDELEKRIDKLETKT